MKFQLQYVTFFVIQSDGKEGSSKTYKHYKTLDRDDYEESALQSFLDDEFMRIHRRKAERNPPSLEVPTKIGRFIVEEGFGLESNPNYALFQRLRNAADWQQFKDYSDDLIRMYMDTSAVRGGALMVVSAKLNEYSDVPFIFLLKCDFEPKIARISEDDQLIRTVEMAISAKNMKSIQYPYMPEDGIIEDWELKIHQASHARYFEEFLKFVTYDKPMPELIQEQVMQIAHQYMDQKFEADEVEAREQEAQSMELWAYSEKRELQEKWEPEQVMEASKHILEFTPELSMQFKLDGIAVKAKLADYGDTVHVAKWHGEYVVILTGEHFQFEKGVSPLELLQPEELEVLLERLHEQKLRQREAAAALESTGDDVPW